MGEKGRVFTGARARFMIDGVTVGYARSVSISEIIEYEPLDVLDNIETEEFVPISYRVTLSAEMFRIVGETLKERGWFPKSGANTEEHLSNILNTGELTAILEDTRTGRIISTVEQVKIQGHNWTVDARGIVGESVDFVAVRVKDESEVA